MIILSLIMYLVCVLLLVKAVFGKVIINETVHMVLMILSICNCLIFAIINENRLDIALTIFICVDGLMLIITAFVLALEYEDKNFYPTLYKFRRLCKKNDKRMYFEFIKLCFYYVLK